MSAADDLPGDYDTVGGILNRVDELNEELTPILERTLGRVEQDGDGWVVENPPDDAPQIEWWTHLAVLFGAALEREYPADDTVVAEEGDST